MFSLVYNIPYFWEDEPLVKSYKEYHQNPEGYSYSKSVIHILKQLVNPAIFYKAEYENRLLRWAQMEVLFPIHMKLYNIFKTDVLIDRFLKSILFAVYTVLIFCFFYNIWQKDNQEKTTSFFKNDKLIVALLLFGYILMLPEMWVLVSYFVDENLLSMVFATIPLVLFFFYYNNFKLKNRTALFVIFFIIVLFTHIATLLKHIGRINFAVIFLFLLFTSRKKLFSGRNLILIFTLFIISFPILGLFQSSSEKNVFDIIGMNFLLAGRQEGIIQKTFEFMKTFHCSFLYHGFFILLLLILFIFLHIYAWLGKKGKCILQDSPVQRLVVFSFFWYLLMALCFFITRGFVMEPKYLLRFEFTFFIVPQALFVVGYAHLVYRKYFPMRRCIQFLIYLFLILAIVHNVGRLNNWKGGWDAYLLGYDTAREYVDSHATNSIMVVKEDHSFPVFFMSTNEIKMAPLTNNTLLCSLKKEYNSVFIAHKDPLVFGGGLKFKHLLLEIKDGSPYGKIKKLFGRYYQPMHLYELQNC